MTAHQERAIHILVHPDHDPEVTRCRVLAVEGVVRVSKPESWFGRYRLVATMNGEAFTRVLGVRGVTNADPVEGVKLIAVLTQPTRIARQYGGHVVTTLPAGTAVRNVTSRAAGYAFEYADAGIHWKLA